MNILNRITVPLPAQLGTLLLAGCYVATLAGCGCSPDHSPTSQTEDPAQTPVVSIKLEDLILTGGAAPGYVDDKVCAECHSDLYEPYQHVGMANSFFRPSADRVIEDFENSRFYHGPSQRYYEMARSDGQYIFKRYQLDNDSKPINVFRRKADWIMGSGNHLRVYLFQTEGGEIFQLPIAWYTQENRWDMAPGYDRPDHQGLNQRIGRDCMFCHNAYPDVPAGSDAYGMSPVYPPQLPAGIGCQRCHGPGGKHVQAALAENPDDEQVLSSLVNLAELDPPEKDDVCNSCHLQPTVTLTGVRRFGRADYSFRPGEAQSDYLWQLDVSEEDQDRSQRFEINHHSYRLHQSACFQESGGALHCTTCHDPHHKVPAEDRVGHYRKACLTCHQADDCGVDEATVEHFSVTKDNCIDCHMPKRRTQDVVHVVMTDHVIRRKPGGSELLVPLDEREPTVTDVEPLDPENGPADDLAEVYRSMALLRATRFTDQPAMRQLKQLLTNGDLPQYEPFLDLADAQLKQRDFHGAQQSVMAVLARKENLPLAHQWLGLALAGQGKADEAIEQFRIALKQEPNNAELHYNLGLMLFAGKQFEEAAEHLQQAISNRSNMTMAWLYLGKAYSELNRFDEATDCFRRSLEIEPTLARGYAAIRQTLAANGEQAEALRYWQHATQVGATGRTTTVVPPTLRAEAQLEPIPAPRLENLDPADADQFKAVQRFFAQRIAQGDTSLEAKLAVFAALGQLYHAYDLLDSAEACYRNASRLATRDFRWRHLLGVVCQQQSRLPDAAEHFAAARQLEPDYYPTPLRLGNVYLQLNRWDDAQRQFEAVEDSTEAAPAAVYGLGEVALAQDKYAEAIKYFQQALELAPQANRIHHSMAMAYRELGEEVKTNEHLEKQGDAEVPAIDPLVQNLRKRFLGEGLYLVQGYMAFNAGRFQEAADAFRKAVVGIPDSARAHVNLSTSLAKVGDTAGAIRHSQAALELDPQNTAAHFNLGVFLTDEHEFEPAIEHLRAVVAAKPNDVRAAGQLAETLLLAGQEDESLEKYRRFVELAPDNEAGLLKLQSLLRSKQQFGEALDLLAGAHERFPDRTDTAHALAQLLAECPDAKLRDGPRAVVLATNVHRATRRPEHAETQAKALAEAGRFDEAVKIQKELIAEARRINKIEIEKRLTAALLRYEKGLGPAAAETSADKSQPPEDSQSPDPAEADPNPTP